MVVDLAEVAVVEGVAVVRGDVSTEFLKKLYFEKKLSLPQIAKLTNFPACSIRYRFKKENIKLRGISEGTRLAMRRPEIIKRTSKTWFKKGIIPWNKGKPWSEKYKEEMRKIQKQNLKLLNNPNVKKTQFKKGSIPWNKNKKMSDKYREKISKATKKAMKNPEIREKVKKTQFKIGHATWNKGVPRSEETKRKLSKRISELIKNNPDYLRKILIFRRPNKAEKKLDNWIQSSFPNEFKFVGNGSFIIEGLNPDWINCNGKKQIIELFGERWHEPEEEQLRKDIFAKYGYRTLVVWYEELKNRKLVLNKIQHFLKDHLADGKNSKS